MVVHKIGRPGSVPGAENNRKFWGLSFSYSNLIQTHNLFIPKTGIQKSFHLDKKNQMALCNALSGLGQVRVGTFISVKEQNSTLCFNVQEITAQTAKLQLNYIEHKARHYIHARYAATMQVLSEEFKQNGLTVSFKRSDEKIWTPVDIGMALNLTALAIDTGETYRIKVTGGSPETRQSALLDLWLAIKAEEEIDLEIEAVKKSAKDVKQPAISEPNFIEIEDQNKFEGGVYQSHLTHFFAGKMESYHGKLVVWNFYKSFDKVAGLLIKDVPAAKIKAIFEYLIVNYDRRSNVETDTLRKQNWMRFVLIFQDIQNRLFKTAGDKDEIPVNELDKFFTDLLAKQKGRNKENVEMVINYMVKGILGEKMESELPKSEQPIVLCAPSLSMKEAEDMPSNVICFLATELRDGSHPYEILNGKGIKTFTVRDSVGDFINGDDKKLESNNQPCSIVIGNTNLWLNVGLPENVHQNDIRLQNLAGEEDIRALAFNWLPRRIIGGTRDVRIQATIRGYTENMRNEFMLRSPDGIGLYTTENSHIKKERLLTEPEMLNELDELCAMTKRITMRLEDVSSKEDKIRRDEKELPGIENKDNLSGASFLLCEEGQKKLLRPRFRAALETHLKWKKDGREIRIMVPYLTNSSQIEQIRAILQECKDEVVKKHIKPDMPEREVDLIRESLRIPLGAMLETRDIFTENAKDGAYNCENIARKSDFGSVGLNDLRHSFGTKEGEDVTDASIFDPKMVKAINEAVKQYSKFSTPLSVCGKINGNREFLLLNVLGIEDFSAIFDDIRPFSESVRLYKQEELGSMKEKILKASNRQEVEGILDAGQKHIIERLKDQAVHAGTMGNILRSEAEEARLGRLRSTKIKVMAKIFNIIKDKEANKEERILSVLMDNLPKDEFLEIPKPNDVTNWLSNEMLIIAFLDEWVIRNAIGVKCRCTPYIFHRSEDGELWARAIPRRGVTGYMSRYYFKDEGWTKVESEDLHMIKVNYFNNKDKETRSTLCVLKPVKGYTDRFEVTVKVEGEPEENIQLIARKENGQTQYYRKLAAEKLLVARILNGEQAVPSDPSIIKSQHEKVNSVFILDRMGLSELKDIHVKDLKTSIDRDRKNMFYQPEKAEEVDPYNINQALFIKMRALNGSQSYVIAVDNWVENKSGYQPLLEDKAHLDRITQFLGIEADEDEVLSNMILDNSKLEQENAKLNEQAKIAHDKRKNLIMMQRKMLRLKKAKNQPNPGT